MSSVRRQGKNTKELIIINYAAERVVTVPNHVSHFNKDHWMGHSSDSGQICFD